MSDKLKLTDSTLDLLWTVLSKAGRGDLLHIPAAIRELRDLAKAVCQNGHATEDGKWVVDQSRINKLRKVLPT